MYQHVKNSVSVILLLVCVLPHHLQANGDTFAPTSTTKQIEELRKRLDELQDIQKTSLRNDIWSEYQQQLWRHYYQSETKKSEINLAQAEMASLERYQRSSAAYNNALQAARGDVDRVTDAELRSDMRNINSALQKLRHGNMTNEWLHDAFRQETQGAHAYAAKKQVSPFLDGSIQAGDVVVNNSYLSLSGSKYVALRYHESGARTRVDRKLLVCVKSKKLPIIDVPKVRPDRATEPGTNLLEGLYQPKTYFKVAAVRKTGDGYVYVVLEELPLDSAEYRLNYSFGFKAKEITTGAEEDMAEPVDSSSGCSVQ